ncbi:ABC-type nitrate/sulfonate/bicarbonate transport system, permease component [Quadrisphaera granulorum]|uniref:ABC-type nitrate/sulfonate/bicarbonate transport system permease component n=1 Tax=Quadrisphaera granulorum TaxID=317664 RepID=A0A316ADR9_9ACTN|nr:ABC transporter permease subunit [Quadrisphaera granulorum]PWJ55418.1 ABC-type nitrate/sulfonate/bicarbonate transport system permease component [Quadrisphaera granulorum]SZE95482.1 ABC-type nitrate/sulfonate/bicarbonate transport system, permease component [Quadrisphaera granulorum]
MTDQTFAPPTEHEVAARVRISRERPRWLAGAIGIVGILVLWSLLAVTVFADGGGVPTPWAVVAKMGSDGWSLYGPNASITVGSAAQGFLWGNAFALLLAGAVLVVPQLDGLVTQLGVISYCIPLTAIGPIIQIVFGGRSTSIFLAAVAVFFTTLIGALLGLRAADRTSIDMVAAYGGSRLQQLLKVRLISSLPSLLAALMIAAPAAMLGAIIGEYLGGVDSGLGVALTNAQQQFDVPRTWGLAIATGAIAGAGYLIFSLVSRAVTPWSAGQEGTS